MQFSIAMLVTAALAGLSSASPAVARDQSYVPGQCGIHVTQWQKNENGVGAEYQFDVVVKDAIQEIIGGASRRPIPDFQSSAIDSRLNYTVVLTVGSVDSDPVNFAYAGHRFSSSNGCSTGGYDGGNREMDCGFQC
ncbi:hypothetical protein F5Y19DRAFT_480554 [Xylariaceae sp. FL1651]|nr:hypothetical protein F5Y19DRAFT_480554 [Xylariaceae sp. FL1651]